MRKVLFIFGELSDSDVDWLAKAGEKVNIPAGTVLIPVGARVVHGQWGEGVVQRYDDDAMVVLFDEMGYKTLALAVIRERALLTAV